MYGFGVIFIIIVLILMFELLRMYVDKGKMFVFKFSLFVIIFIFSLIWVMVFFVDLYGLIK